MDKFIKKIGFIAFIDSSILRFFDSFNVAQGTPFAVQVNMWRLETLSKEYRPTTFMHLPYSMV